MSYTALTIGPIYKTLKQAKKTREIWGASYFFSFVIKEIVKELVGKVAFITPYVKDEVFQKSGGVGLFHDRIIFKSDTVKKDELQNIVDKVLKNIEEKSKNRLRFNFLKNYLQIHIVKIDEENIKNPILDISPYLDSAELFFETQRDEKNEILEFVKNRLNGSFLAKDAFDDRVSFPSLPKIALSSLDEDLKASIEDEADEQEVMQEIISNKKYKDIIKPYNKYICLVQADGDNMGKVLEEIGADNKKLSEFSKALFDFCLDATKIVSDFNGKMIYAGGDDLFFFAPVVSGEKNIFNLCNDLSKIFDKKMKSLNLEQSFASLSFGVSITYYKFPLYEARENGVKLLFEQAKSGQKNAIAFRVTKHSGQTFESIVRKDEKVLFEKFLEITQFNDSFDSNFLHSIYTKIDRHKTTIEEIASSDNKKVRIKNFFDNNFNETEHKKYREFFESLTNFIVVVYESEIEDKLNFIYSSLRFKKFLLGDK